MTRWVTNSSPVIFLSKLGRLDLLRISTEKVLIPDEVVEEIERYDDVAAADLRRALGQWLEQRPVKHSSSLSTLRAELGAGEAAAITLAQEMSAERVVLDDLDARRWALRLDLRVTGTVGLLLAAKLKGRIPSLESELERLEELGFWISQPLLEAVLVMASER